MMQTELRRALRTAGTEIEDGRLTMEAAGETYLYLKVPRSQPLDEEEPVAKIDLSGDGWSTAADLRMRDVDALIETLEAIRDGEVFEDA